VLFTTLQAVAVAGYMAVALVPSPAAIWAATTFEHLVGGMATAALFTAMMDTCRPGHEANDYTVQASAVVVATGAAASVSGFMAHALGYAGHFAASAAIGLAGVIYVAWYRDAGDFALLPAPAGEPARGPVTDAG
jgi:predicted MFS family arabinose efflux permease